MSPAETPDNARTLRDRDLDVSLGRRLALGFGTLFVVVAGFAAAVFVWHSRSANAQREYTERIAPIALHADALERRLLYIGIGMRSYLLVPDETRLATFHRYAAEADAAVHALQRTADDGNRAIANRIAAEAAAYIEATGRLVASM